VLSIGRDCCKYTLIHVVETVGAMLYGENIDDHETLVDEKTFEKSSDADRRRFNS
jgi:manganese transport protein